VQEAAAAFRQLVADATTEPPLDEGALLIAAVGSGADVDAGLVRLDDLAADAHRAAHTPTELVDFLFHQRGFAGNTLDYHDPRNSFLPDVLERRLGIPISLSVVLIEIGRRIGIPLHGVGMPGHFLVGVDGDPDAFFDPFHAGAALDAAGCRARFAELQGPAAPFRPEYLGPTGSRLILLRMLANLREIYVARRSPAAQWVVEAQLAFPELTAGERGAAGDVLASVGAFTAAATVFDELAGAAPDADAAAAWTQRAVGHRSRAN